MHEANVNVTVKMVKILLARIAAPDYRWQINHLQFVFKITEATAWYYSSLAIEREHVDGESSPIAHLNDRCACALKIAHSALFDNQILI